MNTINHITVEELNLLREKDPTCQIVDVREVPEYQYVRISGSKLVPLSEFEQKMNVIKNDTPAYFLCGIGKRALKAAEHLASCGYKDLFVIEGGIKAWLEAGYPVEQG